MRLKNGVDIDIRRARRCDAADIIRYLNTVGGESDNLLFGSGGFHMSVEDEEAFIENTGKSPFCALLTGWIGDELACVGNIASPPRERIAHQGNVSLSVLKKYWGIGAGSALMGELIAFARKTGSIEVLHLGVRVENAAAIALYRKFGFEQIGTYRKFFKINGEYYDEILMNLYL